MKIIEYNDLYAEKVAEMWNKSNSNWENSESKMSKGDVIATESNSGNIKLYIAIDNDEVVGYCSLSEYKYDEGASYLPLLNVTPEYHGKKIGKALILKVLEDAIDSRWPRFDLFTWSGNIKAMPLYKKCGFFWERGNSNVHLMNFIPYLFQTEALKEYLNKIDWYKDSKRVIDMEQDGIEKSGFEYYRYDFENQETKLSVEYEKTGRGLRYIETPDYLIEMIIDEHDLVFNNEYDVKFRLVNKSKRNLEIKFEGINNKNITFSMNKTINVIDEITIISAFHVGVIKKDQNKGETHPVIEANLLINGKLANLKIGIEPKFPVKLKLNGVEFNHVLNKEYECYLDIENNLPTKENFEIKLPSSFVDFKGNISIELDSLEKRSIKLKYSLKDYGYYNEIASITYDNKIVKKRISFPFKGSNTSFNCLMEDKAYLISGNYVFVLDLQNHYMGVVNQYGSRAQSAFFVPQIGMPYSLEFNNVKPTIEFTSDNDLKIIFNSKTFKDVQVIVYVNHNYGILTVSYELINNGVTKNLSLSIPMAYSLKDSIIPYKGKLLEVIGNDGSGLQNINHELVDENWLYNDTLKYGVTWDNKEEMIISDWKMTFDKTNIELNTGESYLSSKFYCSFVHPNVKEFRAFSGNKGTRKKVKYLELNINNGNPFSKGAVEVGLINNRKTDISGTICVDELSASIDSSLKVNPGFMKIKVSLRDRLVTYNRLVHEIKGDIDLTEKDGVLEVSNGVLSFKASANYADSIYSLKFAGYEWLDSNYPTPKERVWWADFVGGITQRSQGIQDNTALKESRSVEFIKLIDNFGNEWQGIKVSLIIEKDPDLKGLIYDTYCLTLPGVKLIHTFSNITNNSGKLIFKKAFHRFTTLKIDDDPFAVTFKSNNTNYKCNDISVEVLADKLAILEGNRNYKLGIYNKKNDLLLETQTGYNIMFSQSKIDIPDKESKQLAGDYIIFTKEDIDKDCLIDLDNIEFKLKFLLGGK